MEEKALQTQQAGFFAFLERMAKNPDVDVAKIEKFMDMQERILDRDARQMFNAAMVRAQSRIKLVVAKKYNEQTKSRYADLKSILTDTKDVYTGEGFSLMFYEMESEKQGHIRVGVDIMHEQGHTETRYADIAVQTTGIAGKTMMTLVHGEGSAFSYGRRYLTCLIFNIPTGDDDDGNSAGGKIGDYISNEQLGVITDYINEFGVDEAKFCQFMKVDDLTHIPASDYNKAVAALKQKEKKRCSQ